MCGRYTLTATNEELAEVFALLDVPALEPRYNIAPTQNVPVVRVLETSRPRLLHLLRWGLIPHWAKDPGIGSRMINARCESVDTKPAFREAFRRRRCLPLSDGFYEWKRLGTKKQPYYIRRNDGQPFAFAGLWEHWQGPDETLIDSYTILTTEPNDLVEPLHNRMPVILSPQDYDLWLDPEVQDARRLKPLLRPCDSGEFVADPVGTRVNNSANDDPSCVVPLDSHA